MITKEDYLAIRNYITDDLDKRITIVIEQKLNDWFNTNIKQLVDNEIKEQFRKMMIVKFGE